MIRQLTPCRASSAAIVRPTGPAPTTRISGMLPPWSYTLSILAVASLLTAAAMHTLLNGGPKNRGFALSGRLHRAARSSRGTARRSKSRYIIQRFSRSGCNGPRVLALLPSAELEIRVVGSQHRAHHLAYHTCIP